MMSSESISMGASNLGSPPSYTTATEKTTSPAAAASPQQSQTESASAIVPASNMATAQESTAAPLTPAEASSALKASAAQEQDEAQEPGPLDVDELRALIEEVNSTLYSMNRALRFEVHDKTEDLVVHVVNTKTEEVVRQYPSEEVLRRRELLLAGEVTAFTARVD